MSKLFESKGDVRTLDDSLLWVAFGYAIDDRRMTSDEAKERFDALQIGDTLFDEDGATWGRIA